MSETKSRNFIHSDFTTSKLEKGMKKPKVQSYKSLYHYTLNTGHGNHSPRSGVQDSVIDILRPIVLDGRGNIPNTDLTIKRDTTGTSAMFTIFSVAPLITCGLVMDKEDASIIWSPLSELQVQTDAFIGINSVRREPPDQYPLLAVYIIPTVAMVPHSTLMMLGDLERCIAWTIIDSLSRSRKV